MTGLLLAGLSPRPVTAYTVMVYSTPGLMPVMVAVDTVPGTVNSCTGLLPPRKSRLKKKCNGSVKHAFKITTKTRMVLYASS